MSVDFLHTDNISIKVLRKLMLSFLMGLARHPQSTQKGLYYLVNIPRKKEQSLSFCIQVNIKVFHKLLLSFLTGAARHAQSIQNNKFPIS